MAPDDSRFADSETSAFSAMRKRFSGDQGGPTDMGGGHGGGGGGGGYYGYRSEAPPPDGSNLFSFWEIMRILTKWWWIIALIVVVSIAMAAFVTLRETPMYRASTTIEIKQQESNIVDVSDVEEITADDEYMATQYSLLRSTALAERVADTLNLPSDPAFADQDAARDVRRRQAARTIVENLRVAPVGQSRLIQISFESEDPETSAVIADAIADSFIAYNLDRKYNATSYARDFLEERIKATKAALERSERDLISYAEQQGIVNVGSATAESASEASGSLDSAALVSLNSVLTEARTERMSIEERYRQARSSEMTPDFQNNPAIASLQTRRGDLNAEYQEKLAYLKPGFPEMQELKSRIDFLERQIAEERQNVTASLRSQYEAAVAREQNLQERVNALKASVIDVRNKSVDYNILQREVDTNRAQYDALLQRLKEVSISDGIGTNLVSVVDRAETPEQPFSPNIKRAVITAALLSCMLGLGLAYAVEFIDDRIKVPDDFKTKLSLPILGVIPLMRKSNTLMDLLNDPKSNIVEAYASMRTNLQFANAAGGPKVMQVTSTRSGEGKSSTAYALAKSFAALDKKTLIIDADLRMPSFPKGQDRSIGLAGVLETDTPIEETILATQVPHLSLLPCGKSPPNPSEILAKSRFEQVLAHARKHFDVVIVDSPPTLGLADAPLLGAKCDATILVVEAGAIRTPSVRLTIERLRNSGTSLVGAVLTKYKPSMSGYLDYYQYSYGNDFNKYGAAQNKRQTKNAKQSLDIL